MEATASSSFRDGQIGGMKRYDAENSLENIQDPKELIESEGSLDKPHLVRSHRELVDLILEYGSTKLGFWA